MIGEDERIDREALRRLIQENFADAQLMDDCVNGVQTLASVARQPPDILILDINMPEPNGIQIVKRLRRDGYRGKIMIHTAYDSFSYAQDALNYGADAFLLKPVKHSQFIAAMRALVDQLHQRAQDMGRHIAQELSDYLIPEYLLSQGTAAEQRRNVWKYLEQSIASASLLLMCVSSEARMMLNLRHGTAWQTFQQIEEGIRRSLTDEFKLLRFPDLDGGWMIFYSSPTPVPERILRLRTLHMAGRLLLLILQQHGVLLQSAMEVSAGGIKAFRDAVDSLRRKASSQTIEQLLLSNEEIVRALIPDEEAIRFIERYGHEPFGAQWMDSQKTAQDDPARLFAFGAALILSVDRTLGKAAGTREAANCGGAIAQYYPKRLEQGDILSWIEHTVQETLREYYRRRQKSAELVLKRACTYIKQEYHRDLALQEVANHTGVSASYLSHQFKEKLGIGFIDYLQGVRMQELMRLLRQKDYSIRELAQLLGYNSHTYFCRVVRQRTGKTINQLKRQLAQEKSEK